MRAQLAACAVQRLARSSHTPVTSLQVRVQCFPDFLTRQLRTGSTVSTLMKSATSCNSLRNAAGRLKAALNARSFKKELILIANTPLDRTVLIQVGCLPVPLRKCVRPCCGHAMSAATSMCRHPPSTPAQHCAWCAYMVPRQQAFTHRLDCCPLDESHAGL